MNIPQNAQGDYLLSQLINAPVTVALTAQNPIVSGQFTVTVVDAQGNALANASGVPSTDVVGTCGGLNGVNNYYAFTCTFTPNPNLAFASGVTATPVYVKIAATGMTGHMKIVDTVSNVAPVLPANMPTAFTVNGASGSIDLTPYIPAGASLVLVSVADPSNGVLGGVGGPNASVSGGIVSISVPTFYGTSNIPMTLKFVNSAGSSPNFVVTANGMSN